MDHKHGRSRSRSTIAGALRSGRAVWIMAAAGGALATAIIAAACSLGNIKRDDCTSSAQCATVFGAGSTCQNGYCSPAQNADCQSKNDAGIACFACAIKKDPLDFANACTNAECAPFDNKTRLTKLPPDGKLPSLP